MAARWLAWRRRVPTDLRSRIAYAAAAALTVAGFFVAYQFVEPAPPDHLTLATGSSGGAYFEFGRRYAAILAKSGITLEVSETAGSVENLDRLQNNSAQVAFIQGGIPHNGPAVAELVSLGSLFYEPFWIFVHANAGIATLRDLHGRRIAIGEEGSGTRAVALQLLQETGIVGSPTELLPLDASRGADALRAGTVDAVFYVASPRAATVSRLLHMSGVAPLAVDRAEAYVRLHRVYSKVILPEGVIDMANDIPRRDVALIAPAANLVARADLHPALVSLLLEAATEVHRQGGLFEEPGAFPSPKHLEFPLSAGARRFYENGSPLLQRYLPFWMANLVDRLKVMLVPLLTLLIPFARVLPPVLRWRERSKIYRWYRGLQAIDLRARSAKSPAEFDACRAELAGIEPEATQIAVPTSYGNELYNLHLHIAHVRRLLDRLQEVRSR